MYTPIVTAIEIIISGMDMLASLKDSLGKSKKEELCNSLYRIYVGIQQILDYSKEIITKFDRIENSDEVQEIHEMNLQLARELSSLSRDLWKLNDYLELVAPRLYWDFHYAFGYKLVLLDIMRKYYEDVTRKKDNKMVKIFRSIDFDRLTDTNYGELEYLDIDRNLKYIASMRSAGLIEIMEFEPTDHDAKTFIVRQGISNIRMLEALKENLRDFLVSNFKMEDLFFPRRRLLLFRRGKSD